MALIESSNRGIILKTDNGALTWETIMINYSSNTTTSDFKSVYLISGNNIWAATSDGFLYNSLDGGDNWEMSFVTAFGINKVRFYDENFGVIVCNSGRIGITTNGGNNWSIVTNGK